MNRYLLFFVYLLSFVPFAACADAVSSAPPIHEVKTRILFQTKFLEETVGHGKSPFYDILPHYRPSGEEFYSFRLLDAWASLPEGIQKNGADGVACDDQGVFWAVNGQGLHVVLNAVSKKIIYQEKDQPPAAGENLVAEGGYWLQVSPGGKYIVQVHVDEGTDIGNLIDSATLKKLHISLTDLGGLYGGDRYLVGQFKGKEGNWVLDTLKQAYFPANPAFFTPWSGNFAISGDGKTIFRPQADGGKNFQVWRLPALKQLQTVSWDDPNRPIDVQHFSPFACQGPDLFGIADGESVYAVNLKTGKHRKFHFVFLKEGILQLIENDTTLQPWADIAWDLGPASLPEVIGGENPPPGTILHANPKTVPSIVFPDDRKDGFWIFTCTTTDMVREAPAPLPPATVQTNPSPTPGSSIQDVGRPQHRNHKRGLLQAPLSQAVAVYINKDLIVETILRYDRPFEPVNGFYNPSMDRFGITLCRFYSQNHSIRVIDKDSHMVEFPLR